MLSNRYNRKSCCVLLLLFFFFNFLVDCCGLFLPILPWLGMYVRWWLRQRGPVFRTHVAVVSGPTIGLGGGFITYPT